MIITKKRFNLTPGYRKKWPFSVSQVPIAMILDPENKLALWILIHNFGIFALSGALESHGYTPLVESGIWLDEQQPRTCHDGEIINVDAKKSLTPFFQFIEAMAVRELGVKDA